jgi:hypothetical protein
MSVLCTRIWHLEDLEEKKLMIFSNLIFIPTTHSVVVLGSTAWVRGVKRWD